MDGTTIHALQDKADLAVLRYTIHQRRFERLTPEELCAGLRIPRARAERILAEWAGTCLQEEIWAIKASVLYTAIAEDPGADLEHLLRQVGFESVFTACSIFRHCYGLSPMRFRVQCQCAWRQSLAA